MASSINASLTAGIVQTADTSGNLNLQSGGTTIVAITSTGASVTGLLEGSTNYTGFKNRIINGGMVIDQRNAGASVTNNVTGTQYSLDRWNIYGNFVSKFTVQQNAGAVTPPVGFKNYLGVTSSAATTVNSTDTYIILQKIEGFNTADLAWGTANAATVTLSFRVYSSLTGTFGGSILNSAQDRSYPFTYSIPVANTWTTISVTIAGDTTGTWIGATNGIGLSVFLSLGTGSTLSGTAGAWAGAQYYSATGAVNVVSTNGATFYITGVQLEKGSTATSFDVRDYGRELAMCQRYFETNFSGVTIPTNNYAYYSTATVGSNTYAGGAAASQQAVGPFTYRVTKRASPTVTIYSWSSSSTERVSNGWTGADFAANSGKLNISGYDGFSFYNNSGSNITTGGYSLIFNYTASAEL
jgi:hypothetical protein